MSYEDTAELMFSTAISDFEQKQRDLSDVATRMSHLVAVDTILFGFITFALKFSVPNFLSTVFIRMTIYTLAPLTTSIFLAILAVFPRQGKYEIKIEEIVSSFQEDNNYSEFFTGLIHYIVKITRRVRKLVDTRMDYIWCGWVLTITSLTTFATFIFIIFFIIQLV